MVHHFTAMRSTSASWGRRLQEGMRTASGGLLSKPPPPTSRFPIPLALPVEIMLGIFEMLPPEAAVSVVCCCWYMHGLYCEEGTFASDQLWTHLLKRTFPARLTGAPGPNAPPRLRSRSNYATLATLSNDWVHYVRELRQAPKVTGVQIAKFVRWAASAHSWYKHIPLQDAAVFSFVLDLTVGMKRTPDGFVEQHEGDARTHYSWLPTRAYRDAFGLLTYRDALPAFQPAIAEGPRSVGVQKVDGGRVWVPSHLVELGSCPVTAACHGRAEAYEIYHHPYAAYARARSSGTLGDLSSAAADARRRHSYSYLNKGEQQQHFRTLPPEVLADFEALHEFQLSGQDHRAEAQCALIQKLFPKLSPKQVAKLQDRRVWGSPWQPGGAYLGAPNIVVTAQKAREWQRMFDRAAAFCEAIYGEKVNMDGVKPCTMTCLALETLPMPAFDIIDIY